MTKQRIVLGLVVLLILIIISIVIWQMAAPSSAPAPAPVVTAPTIPITSANNIFQIGLCGSCVGPPNLVAADVNGSITAGQYPPAALALALQNSMNVATQGVTGLSGEWTVTYDPVQKIFSVVTNNKRAWTFKTVPNNIYATIGMTSFADKYWTWWNGTAANSTAVGAPLPL